MWAWEVAELVSPSLHWDWVGARSPVCIARGRASSPSRPALLLGEAGEELNQFSGAQATGANSPMAPVLTQAMNIITDPGCSWVMNPDMALGLNTSLDIIWPQVAALATHHRLFLSVMESSALPLSTACTNRSISPFLPFPHRTPLHCSAACPPRLGCCAVCVCVCVYTFDLH